MRPNSSPVYRGLLSLLLGLSTLFAGRQAVANALENDFRSPPPDSRIWCYWYWISNNISKEGVTKDLEAMKRAGIGTALIGNQYFPDQPEGNIPLLSEAFWDVMVHAVREGQRLGIDIGVFNCPGWSMSGGPWVKPEQAMRYLARTEKTVQGPIVFDETLPAPGEHFQEVAVLAIPLGEPVPPLLSRNPAIQTNPGQAGAFRLVDNDPATAFNLRAGANTGPLEIDLRVDTPFTARSLTLTPGEGNFKASLKVEAWVGDGFVTIGQGQYDRRNPRVDVGPMPKGPVVIELSETQSDRYRLTFSGFEVDPGNRPNTPVAEIAEIDLSPASRVAYHVEKQLGKMFPRPLPLWGAYLWPQAIESNQQVAAVAPNDVINLTGKTSVQLPEGRWLIQRIGMLPTGARNNPAAPNGTGLEVDKMSRKHLAAHFDAFVGELLRRLTPQEKKTLKYVVGDSYEKGSQNWTDGFAQQFEDVYGYDPIPFLPVLSGQVIQDTRASDGFLWDLRRLVADKITSEYVGGLRELCNEHGMKLWLENYGHWGFPGEFMSYGGQCDMVAGEFWVTGTLGNIECRAAASTAHAYGQQRVYAEAFTSGTNWDYAPYDMKRRGDWAFTEGINHFVLHLYIQQPDDQAPGMTAWFGTEFNRNNTWFDEGREWFDYLRRCHVLLQHGQHVADFAYFIGEDAPIMTGTRQPEQPQGYDFDFINAEVLLTRMTIQNGRWTLPEGKSYAVMVLPPLTTMRPHVAQKLQEMVSQGGVLYGELPKQSPSLQAPDQADRLVKNAVDALAAQTSRVFTSGGLKAVVDRIGLPADVGQIDPKQVLWVHRQTDDSDVYFLTNQTQETIQINPVFRVSDAFTPEFWHADTGLIERANRFNVQDQGTRVPITLDPYGSIFVVFRDPQASKDLPVQPKVAGIGQQIKLDQQPWSLSFMPGRDVPEQIALPELALWSDSDNLAIKHYSGTGDYETSFNLPSDWRPGDDDAWLLDLGNVGPMARVYLNGQDLGLLWKPPFEMPVGDALKPGKNTLKVAVTNLWLNRMIGESKYPDGIPGITGEKTFAPTSSIPGKGLDTRPLKPSGLAGPVVLRQEKHNPAGHP